MRIAFRCWQERVQYDDSQYEAALDRRQAAPEPKPSSSFELPIRWTSCGSFQKNRSKKLIKKTLLTRPLRCLVCGHPPGRPAAPPASSGGSKALQSDGEHFHRSPIFFTIFLL